MGGKITSITMLESTSLNSIGATLNKESRDSIFINTQDYEEKYKTVEDIKLAIQEKKNEITSLKSKITPTNKKLIKYSFPVALGSIAGSLATSVAISKGATLLSLAVASQLGAVFLVAGAVGYLVGAAINNQREKICSEKIQQLEQEIVALEQLLKNQVIET